MKSGSSQKKIFVNFVCFEHKTQGLIFLDKAKLSLLSWRTIYGHNAWKHNRRSKKHACLKNYCLS